MNLSTITLDEKCSQTTEHDTLVVWNGCLFNLRAFLEIHPGGRDLILQYSGKDITNVMRSRKIHRHSQAAYALLQTFRIGNAFEEKNRDILNHDMTGWKEDTVDWEQGMVFQVYKFGHDYMKWVQSPVCKELRLFQSGFLEFFSKTRWYFVPLFWLPIICMFITVSFNNLQQLTFGEHSGCVLVFLGLLILVGVFLWTLVEYILHRYLFHLTPPGDSPFWITIHFFLHGQHHKAPFDPKRLVFPPVAASALACPFYIAFTYIFPLGIGQGVFAGGLLGYLMYDMIHYYLHHGHPPAGSYFYRLKQYHVEHHFIDHNTGFGISSKLWDGPFGTMPKKKK